MTGKCEVPKIDNGTLQSGFHVGSFVNHGNVLDYRCNDGFTNESAKPRCDNGTWTSTPLCAPGQSVYAFNYDNVAVCRLDNARRATLVAMLPDHYHPSSSRHIFSQKF